MLVEGWLGSGLIAELLPQQRAGMSRCNLLPLMSPTQRTAEHEVGKHAFVDVSVYTQVPEDEGREIG